MTGRDPIDGNELGGLGDVKTSIAVCCSTLGGAESVRETQRGRVSAHELPHEAIHAIRIKEKL